MSKLREALTESVRFLMLMMQPHFSQQKKQTQQQQTAMTQNAEEIELQPPVRPPLSLIPSRATLH